MNTPLLNGIPKPQRLFVHQDTLEEITHPENFQMHRKQMPLHADRDEEIASQQYNSSTCQPRRQFMTELPNYVRQSVKDLPTFVKQGTEGAVNLPLQASHNWRDLALLILFGHVVGAALPQVALLFLPLPSVNKGLESNRFFLYGILTFYELMITSAFVATFNLAMSEGSIPLQARIASVSAGTFVAKVFDAAVAERWYHDREALFPVPFSLIGSISVSLPFAFGTLYAMLPNKKEIETKERFWKCLYLILSIIASLDIAILWAVVLVILRGSKWQKLWAFAFEILKVICRNFLVGQITLRINPKNLIALQFVVEIVFTGAQITSLAHIEGLASFFVLLFSTPLSLLFRYYAVQDRLVFLLCYSSKTAVMNAVGDKTSNDTVQQHFGSNHLLEVASGLVNMSRAQVHALGMALEQAETQQQMHVDWADESAERIRLEQTEIEMTWNGSGVEESIVEGALNDEHARMSRAEYTDDYDFCECFEDAISEDTAIPMPEPMIGIEIGNPVIIKVAEKVIESKCIETNSLHSMILSPIVSRDWAQKGDSTPPCMMEQCQAISGECESSVGCNSSRAIQEDHESTSGTIDFDGYDAYLSPSSHEPEVVEFANGEIIVENGMHLPEEDLMEESPDQRQLYNTVDAVGSELLATIIRIQFLVAMVLAQSLSIREQVNKTYNLSALARRNGLVFGWVFVLMNVLMIGFFSRAFREHEGDRKLTMSGIVSYIFRNNFWIIYLWLSSAGILSNFVRINHFGADFSFRFEWLSCRSPGEMSWPGCLIK